jgi:hypothetical protein
LINLSVVEPIAGCENLTADFYFLRFGCIEHEEAKPEPFANRFEEWFYFKAWLPDVFTQT